MTRDYSQSTARAIHSRECRECRECKMCGVVPQSWQGGRCAPPLHPPREPCAGSSRFGMGVPAPPQDPTQTNGIAVGSRPGACACPLEPSTMVSPMETTKGRSCPLDTRPTVRRLDGRQRFAAGPRPGRFRSPLDPMTRGAPFGHRSNAPLERRPVLPHSLKKITDSYDVTIQ